jgi:hypothetical protein
VPHPRWSQAKETPLGGAEKVPTRLFNGYEEFVADLYVGMENEPPTQMIVAPDSLAIDTVVLSMFARGQEIAI